MLRRRESLKLGQASRVVKWGWFLMREIEEGERTRLRRAAKAMRISAR